MWGRVYLFAAVKKLNFVSLVISSEIIQSQDPGGSNKEAAKPTEIERRESVPSVGNRYGFLL